jgi:AbrB family looped-hinge helix DNA binding protein
MKTTISSRGQIVLPVAFREQDHIVPGQEFSIERLDSGEYLIKRIAFPPEIGCGKLAVELPGKRLVPACRV